MQITLDELKAIEAPAPTRTWNPIPHYEIYEQVEKCLQKIGITTISTKVDTNKTGTNVFVSHQVDVGNKDNERLPQIGWRNSISKKLSLGFTSGTQIIVCSNLVFKGDWMEFRKHNSKLEISTVREMAFNGIAAMIENTQQLNNWHDNMKKIERSKQYADHLFVEFLRKGVITSRQINDLVNAYDEEVDRYGESLYTIYNCATQTFRELALPTISERSRRLNEIVQADMGEQIIDVDYEEVA